jgi:hypothetical protein
MAGGERHQIAQHGLSLLLCDLMAVGQFGGEVLEGDGRLRRSFRWGCLLCGGFLDWHRDSSLGWASYDLDLSRSTDSSNPNVALPT